MPEVYIVKGDGLGDPRGPIEIDSIEEYLRREDFRGRDIAAEINKLDIPPRRGHELLDFLDEAGTTYRKAAERSIIPEPMALEERAVALETRMVGAMAAGKMLPREYTTETGWFLKSNYEKVKSHIENAKSNLEVRQAFDEARAFARFAKNASRIEDKSLAEEVQGREAQYLELFKIAKAKLEENSPVKTENLEAVDKAHVEIMLDRLTIHQEKIEHQNYDALTAREWVEIKKNQVIAESMIEGLSRKVTPEQKFDLDKLVQAHEKGQKELHKQTMIRGGIPELVVNMVDQAKVLPAKNAFVDDRARAERTESKDIWMDDMKFVAEISEEIYHKIPYNVGQKDISQENMKQNERERALQEAHGKYVGPRTTLNEMDIKERDKVLREKDLGIVKATQQAYANRTDNGMIGQKWQRLANIARNHAIDLKEGQDKVYHINKVLEKTKGMER